MGNFVLDMLRGATGGNAGNGGFNQMGGILKLFGQIAHSSNPDEAFMALAQQNGQVQDIVKMINEQYNGDGKAAFYAKAKEMGIDPNDVLSMLK